MTPIPMILIIIDFKKSNNNDNIFNYIVNNLKKIILTIMRIKVIT